MSVQLGSAFDNTPVVPPPPDPVETLSLRLLSAIEQLQAAVATLQPQTLPAPIVQVEPPDLSEIVTAVTALNGTRGPSSEDIARAIANTLKIPQPQGATGELKEVAEALKKLDFRLQGVGTQAYGGGSVTIQPNQSIGVNNFPSNQTGTWGYRAGANGTVVVPPGGKVLGIIAHSTTGSGTVTINGGDAIPVPANVGLELEPLGNLVAPTVVFSANVDTYVVEYLT